MALDGETGKRLEGTLKAGMPDPATLTLATASGDVLTSAANRPRERATAIRANACSSKSPRRPSPAAIR